MEFRDVHELVINKLRSVVIRYRLPLSPQQSPVNRKIYGTFFVIHLLLALDSIKKRAQTILLCLNKSILFEPFYLDLSITSYYSSIIMIPIKMSAMIAGNEVDIASKDMLTQFAWKVSA